MTFPLIFLAIASAIVGFIPFSNFVTSDGLPFDMHIHWEIAIPSIAIALFGIIVAFLFYKKESNLPERATISFGSFYLSLGDLSIFLSFFWWGHLSIFQSYYLISSICLSFYLSIFLYLYLLSSISYLPSPAVCLLFYIIYFLSSFFRPLSSISHRLYSI